MPTTPLSRPRPSRQLPRPRPAPSWTPARIASDPGLAAVVAAASWPLLMGAWTWLTSTPGRGLSDDRHGEGRLRLPRRDRRGDRPRRAQRRLAAGTARLRATAAEGAPVFIGVASTDEMPRPPGRSRRLRRHRARRAGERRAPGRRAEPGAGRLRDLDRSGPLGSGPSPDLGPAGGSDGRRDGPRLLGRRRRGGRRRRHLPVLANGSGAC